MRASVRSSSSAAAVPSDHDPAIRTSGNRSARRRAASAATPLRPPSKKSEADNVAIGFSYDASSRIANPGYTYDMNGNLLSDGTTSYSYDAANRLIQSVKAGITTEQAATLGIGVQGKVIEELF